jgi:CelD/BcsL family acetyltransferase involved in cellulose biosynthesis
MLFYQSGFDPYWSNFSVGSVLLQIIIEKAFNKNLEEFDFLKGDEEYKKTWANRERKQYRIVVYRKTFKGIFIYLNDNAKTFIKMVANKYCTKSFRNKIKLKFSAKD